MKSSGLLSRRLFRSGVVAAALAAGAAVALRPADAHEAKCPVCKLDVVQDTETLDNEVALKFGRKRIEYRCVFCALTDAKNYEGDLAILAPSETKRKPVTLTRKEGTWSVSPETALFVGQKVNHRQCELGYRAVRDRAGFDAWVKQHGELLKDAQPLTLEQMLALIK